MIDCHTHWGSAWRNRDGDDPSRWLAVLDGYGVTHAVVLPEIALFHAGRVRDDHEHMAAACAASAGRMIPFATANIWFSDEALAELRHALASLRFRGIKFHPWLQGCSVSSPVMDEVCDLAEEFGVPILFHDGTPPFSLPSQMALLAQRHPRVTIILGHMGLLEHWRESIAAMNAAENLWGCLCGPQVGAMREALRRCDRARIVWGSDFGFSLSDCFAYRAPVMEHVGLGDADLEAVMVTNPRRLLQLDGHDGTDA